MDERPLKTWKSKFCRNNFHMTHYEATLIYYEGALKILETYEFQNIIHKKIWELHCQGIPERKIAQQIEVYKKSMVHHIIAKISKLVPR